eukprot:6199518-Pleurochrysis_carterae.AAC.4
MRADSVSDAPTASTIAWSPTTTRWTTGRANDADSPAVRPHRWGALLYCVPVGRRGGGTTSALQARGRETAVINSSVLSGAL